MSDIERSKSEESKNEQLKRRPARLEDYYDFMHDKRGIALIFNHETFYEKSSRGGTKKDGEDLKAVLEGLKFDVRNYMDLNLNGILDILYKVSMEDHSNNDCLLVTVMSHGTIHGKIDAADKSYNVQQLWENFIGDNCESLIGKPKLFFIQACRGNMVDPVFYDVVNATKDPVVTSKNTTKNPVVTSKYADLLIMYSTIEGYYSFRNTKNGSWLIQALCEELKTNQQDDFMCILTRVNDRVAKMISDDPNNEQLDKKKQIPNIQHTLTKSIFFYTKSLIQFERFTKTKSYDTSNTKIGVALIFNNGSFNVQLEREGTKKDVDDLKKVLKKLRFDVRYHQDLKIDEIRYILKEVSKEDHSNKDCFLVTVITNAKENCKITAADAEYDVEELWKNFLGDNCKSLIGKPKLFFIEASRGFMVDPGVSLAFKQIQSEISNRTLLKFIPNFADFLVMHSTSEGHFSLSNPANGSWLIQALCEELKTNQQDDLLNILTGVNARVAEMLSDVHSNAIFSDGKQMPNIVSMLTKLIFLHNNSLQRVSCDNKPERYYNFSNVKRGIALIFNHETFEGKSSRNGTKKDGDDLKAVLKELKFDVRNYMDLKLKEIRNILNNVSFEDHSKNDCLLVTVITHGTEDGKIAAADKEYDVEELWKNFLEENCKTLIGKPKLFFIEASRGSTVDPGVSLVPKKIQSGIKIRRFTIDMNGSDDLLIIQSRANGHCPVRNQNKGSLFIQALCEELKTNQEDDLLNILSSVNRKILEKKSEMYGNDQFNDRKQMPNIISMLTKLIFLHNNSMQRVSSDVKPERYYNFSNVKRGIALIFNHETFNGKSSLNGTKKDGDDLKAVLERLQFDVRYYMDLKLNDISDILYEVSLEDHSNNDCLLVTVITHTIENGKITAADEEYDVKELWENFLEENCESLIGKPKLFFIEASEGDFAEAQLKDPVIVIPKLADLLVMYSTIDSKHAFFNKGDGSWFIQAFCEELNNNSQDGLMRILTRVNGRIASDKQSKVPCNFRCDAAKQVPNIVSMLTKEFHFKSKTKRKMN